ncbi:alpha/beta hydrolase fold domain-containing protein [Nonomuraea recticatena]|uniref:alpha/beta hydrolase fold domain-containing protein n=1 Tax=Nonomuraea recticatena TaxID=46178 RepID=UPI003623673D
MRLDDPLCRYLAAEAEVVVVNVDYMVAPQHPFPAPPRQAFEVVRWVAEHGTEHGWDGGGKARQTYAVIARRVRQATQPSTPVPD